MTTDTFFAGTSDGYIRCANATYATARSGGGTFVVDSSSTGGLPVGQLLQTGMYYVWETFLSFDTASIPDDAIIDSVSLELYGSAHSVTSSGFTIEARMYDWGASLTSADFIPGASLSALPLVASKVLTTDADWNLAGYNALTSESAFVDNINRTGLTSIVLDSSRLVAGSAPTGIEQVQAFSADHGGILTDGDPRLVVEYHLPPGSISFTPLPASGIPTAGVLNFITVSHDAIGSSIYNVTGHGLTWSHGYTHPSGAMSLWVGIGSNPDNSGMSWSYAAQSPTVLNVLHMEAPGAAVGNGGLDAIGNTQARGIVSRQPLRHEHRNDDAGDLPKPCPHWRELGLCVGRCE